VYRRVDVWPRDVVGVSTFGCVAKLARVAGRDALLRVRRGMGKGERIGKPDLFGIGSSKRNVGGIVKK
jgi:hypothetical protein